eukprot:2660608-Prymnesium_polylepis.1
MYNKNVLLLPCTGAHTVRRVRPRSTRLARHSARLAAHVHSLDAHTTTREPTHSLNSAHMAHASRPLATQTHADGLLRARSTYRPDTPQHSRPVS